MNYSTQVFMKGVCDVVNVLSNQGLGKILHEQWKLTLARGDVLEALGGGGGKLREVERGVYSVTLNQLVCSS